MSIFTAEQLDLSRLPQLTFVPHDEEAERLSLVAGIKSRCDAGGVPYSTHMLRTGLVARIAEEFAFRRTLSTIQINDAVRAQYIATSFGAALDHLGRTLYPDLVIERLAAVASPRPYAEAPEDWEDDASYKRRLLLGSEARAPLTPGAYLLTALSYSTDVADAAVLNWSSGLVRRGEELVIVLGKPGVDEAALCAGIAEKIRTRPIRVESDTVIVRPAARRIVAIGGTLVLRRGPDGERVKADRTAAVVALGVERRKIGRTLPAAGISGAMSSSVVERVRGITVDGAPLAGDVIPPLDGVVEIGAVDLDWDQLDG